MSTSIVKDNSIVNIAKRIKSIADVGLLFTENDYDIDRYKELKQLSFDILHQLTEVSLDNIKMGFNKVEDYPTPKVDVRGIVLNKEKEVLLVKERLDGKWTLPGGWCEIGLSPKENLIKEMREETGLGIEPERLLAVFDKKCHPHPPQPYYVYKLVFNCIVTGDAKFNPEYEIIDIKYFSLNNLPELSTDRILESQIRIAYNMIIKNNREVYVD